MSHLSTSKLALACFVDSYLNMHTIVNKSFYSYYNFTERCPAGKYYDHDAGLCRSCGHGFYQPQEGSFSCKICGLGKTTRTNEAVSVKECRDECGSGQQLGFDGKCEACPRGTYRTQGIQAACQSCPLGRTTPKSGASTVEECSLPVCTPGNL